MPSTSTLLVFAAAALAILVVPGPSVVYVVTRTLEHGRLGGLLSMLGIEAGALLHVAAAAAGLTALLATSEGVLLIVRYAGAVYLVVLGLRLVIRTPPRPGTTRAPGDAGWRLFRDGVLVDLLNPKTALFFLAFLPQFVDPLAGQVPLQVVALGLCFVVLAVLCDGTYALLAGSLAGRLWQSASAQRQIGRATAGIYVGLGMFTALA